MLRETVTAMYTPSLATELLKGDYYDIHFSEEEDCMYVWGTFERDDPSYVYMVRLLFPGEA